MKCQNRQFTKFISLLKFPGLQYACGRRKQQQSSGCVGGDIYRLILPWPKHWDNCVHVAQAPDLSSMHVWQSVSVQILFVVHVLVLALTLSAFYPLCSLQCIVCFATFGNWPIAGLLIWGLLECMSIPVRRQNAFEHLIRIFPDLPTDDGVARRNVLMSTPTIPPDLSIDLTASIVSCQSCVVYTTFVGNSVLSFTTSKLNYMSIPFDAFIEC